MVGSSSSGSAEVASGSSDGVAERDGGLDDDRDGGLDDDLGGNSDTSEAGPGSSPVEICGPIPVLGVAGLLGCARGASPVVRGRAVGRGVRAGRVGTCAVRGVGRTDGSWVPGPAATSGRAGGISGPPVGSTMAGTAAVLGSVDGHVGIGTDRIGERTAAPVDSATAAVTESSRATETTPASTIGATARTAALVLGAVGGTSSPVMRTVEHGQDFSRQATSCALATRGAGQPGICSRARVERVPVGISSAVSSTSSP
ncbi:hypothetical protein ACQPZA_29440 [Pseudonocardia xinjiangensis]|uniref:hypothetical protein n=1 Tax=Pseudonocardia xinjiangensis TaxID=75289 RepID=UPI003D941177